MADLKDSKQLEQPRQDTISEAWDQQHPRGRRLHQLNTISWLWKKCAARRKQLDVPEQSPKLSKADPVTAGGQENLVQYHPPKA